MSDVTATYRVQLHEGFTFHDAAAIAPYLAELGISHLYCSPYLQAGEHSTHGYDVLDPTRLNAQLGGAGGFEAMVEALRASGISHIVDIVPNHMAISSRRNKWWWDVLKNGRLSKYASYFDVDWDPPESKLAGMILMPILGDHYGRVLDRGEIRIERNDDELVVAYFEHALPLSPSSIRDLIEIDGSVDESIHHINNDPDAMHELLEAQHYRLAYWRTAGQELGYRRFFDINTLVALRQEDPTVFDATHELTLSLVASGAVDGLRVDHVDGLREPRAYLDRLRDAAGDVFVAVEKILETDERLPTSWRIQGTTGYDFMNDVARLFVDPGAEAAFDDVYRRFTGRLDPFDEVVLANKEMVTRKLLASDLERLTALFVEVCEDNRHYRDFTRPELRECLRAAIAAFPVYRTYVEPDGKGATAEDRRWIERAITAARSRCDDLDPGLFELLHSVLLGTVEGHAGSELLLRFQQLTGPVMAKGMEDTVFYNFNRFVALNEVGGDPSRFGWTVGDFHTRCTERAQRWPHSMLATSTHDTKRAEDVRARLCVLSEIPGAWAAAVERWGAIVDRHRTDGAPDRNDVYLFLQTLVGAWSLTCERAVAYMEKATKEAKSHTSWIDADPDYDAASRSFVEKCFGDAALLSDVERFVGDIVDAGYVNSLAQTLIKLTVPGVADTYQGTEVWDLSLVDPDNRRPVDYSMRREMLHRVRSMTARDAWNERGSGAAKMFLTAAALHVRDKDRREQSYAPLNARGPAAGHVVAFVTGGRVAAVVPRLWRTGRDRFAETTIELQGRWRDAFGDRRFTGDITLAELWADFPVALLIRDA